MTGICRLEYLLTSKEEIRIPPAAVYAILEQEGSKGDPKKVSGDGADVGIMQLNVIHRKGVNRKDPIASIEYGTKELQRWWDVAKRRLGHEDDRDLMLKMAFAGYNGGYRAINAFIKDLIVNQRPSKHRSVNEYMPMAYVYFSRYGGWAGDSDL